MLAINMARIDRDVLMPDEFSAIRQPHPTKPKDMEELPVRHDQRILCLLQEVSDSGAPIDGPTLVGLHGNNSDPPAQFYRTGNPRRLTARWACPVTVLPQSGEKDIGVLSLRALRALHGLRDGLHVPISVPRPHGLSLAELPPPRWVNGTLQEVLSYLEQYLHGTGFLGVERQAENPDHIERHRVGGRVYATIETGCAAGPYLKIGKATSCGPMRRLQMQQTCNWRTLRQVRCWCLTAPKSESSAETAMRHVLERVQGSSRAAGGSEWFRGDISSMLMALDALAKFQKWMPEAN